VTYKGREYALVKKSKPSVCQCEAAAWCGSRLEGPCGRFALG